MRMNARLRVAWALFWNRPVTLIPGKVVKVGRTAYFPPGVYHIRTTGNSIVDDGTGYVPTKT